MIMKKPLEEIFDLYFHGKYSFEEFININIEDHIAQHQSNQRTVFSVNKKLAEFHKFTNVFIVNKLDYDTSVCFSYTENTTVRHCIKPHKDNRYFLSTDIANFFSSIQRIDVINTIQYNINKGNIGIADAERYRDDIVKLITFENTLPAGFSTSGRLSNSILLEFDKEILNHCKQKNITYSRYADDLIFSSNNKNIAQIKPIIETILSKIFNRRLKINHDKTKIYSKKSKIKILGLVITPNGNITIDKKIKSDTETAMYFYTNDADKFDSFLKKRFDGRIKKIFGAVSYINSVDKEFLNKLRKKYGNYIVDSFLRQSAK